MSAPLADASFEEPLDFPSHLFSREQEGNGKAVESSLRHYGYDTPNEFSLSPAFGDNDYSTSHGNCPDFIDRQAGDAYSAAMSRTQSTAFNDQGFGHLSSTHEDGSNYGDCPAGILLDQMEGICSDSRSQDADQQVPLDNQWSSFETDYAWDTTISGSAQSAPAFVGAVFQEAEKWSDDVWDQPNLLLADPPCSSQFNEDCRLSELADRAVRLKSDASGGYQGGSPTNEPASTSTSEIWGTTKSKKARGRAMSSPQLETTSCLPPTSSRLQRRTAGLRGDSIKLAAIAERRENIASSPSSSSTGASKVRRAGRTGCLSEQGRVKAAILRNNRCTCQACKVKKISVSLCVGKTRSCVSLMFHALSSVMVCRLVRSVKRAATGGLACLQNGVLLSNTLHSALLVSECPIIHLLPLTQPTSAARSPCSSSRPQSCARGFTHLRVWRNDGLSRQVSRGLHCSARQRHRHIISYYSSNML